LSHMQGFKIEIHEGIYDVFLQGSFIGHVMYSDVDMMYLVYPRDVDYSGQFATLEEAIIELVFHMYRKDIDKISVC